MNKINFCLFAYLLICLFLASEKQAHAQNVSLGVYPPILKINLNPPASISQGIALKNFTDNPLTLSIVFKAFKSSPSNNGELTYVDNDKDMPGNDPDIFDKMQIFDGGHVVKVISLKPQEEKTLTLHMGIPENEPASDYYFSILFINQAIINDQSSSAGIAGGIGTNVLLSIGPETATTGFIKAFSSPFFVQHGPVPFTVALQNNSTHFINPKGSIVVQNMFGQNIGKVTLLPVNILEKSARFIPDEKNINETHAIWPEKFLLGLYKAQLTVALSEQGPLFNRTIYFFALPTEGIIILIGLIIIGVIVFVRVRERLKHL